MTDLRECPFCGLGNAMLLGSGGVYWVECRDCLCQTHTRTTEKTAREAWNRRVQKTPDYPSEPLAFIEHRCKNCGHIDAIKIGSKNR